jgi:hypothetical protein
MMITTIAIERTGCETVAADHNSDQARYFRDSVSEKCLPYVEASIEASARILDRTSAGWLAGGLTGSPAMACCKACET